MGEFVVTPQAFFDLFILCLSWQWSPEQYTKTWTTGDKVARILHGLGILNERQRQILHKDTRTRRIFLRNIRIINTNTPLSTTKSEIKNSAGIVMGTQETLLDQPEVLVLTLPIASVLDQNRLLRDSRLHLTYRGKAYAEAAEAKYAAVLTEERYHAEVERQGKPAAIGAVMQKYRRRIAQDE